jgi:hypothetical protein
LGFELDMLSKSDTQVAFQSPEGKSRSNQPNQKLGIVRSLISEWEYKAKTKELLPFQEDRGGVKEDVADEEEFWKEILFVISASFSLSKPILESRLSLFLYW